VVETSGRTVDDVVADVLQQMERPPVA